MLFVTCLASVYFFINGVFGDLGASFLKHQSGDLACDAGTRTDFGIVGNVIACSRICSGRAGCRGFHFDETDGRCWGSDQTRCQAVPGAVYYDKNCNAPPAIPNADVSTGGTLEGDTRTYTCSPGYVLHNATTLDTTCQHNSTWSTPSFDCLLDCGAPPSVQNATVSGGDTVEATVRTYTCSDGYTINGSATVICQADATWSAVAFSCVADCGAPSAIANAVVSVGGTLEGDTRTYSCSTGHVLRNVVTLNTTCQPDTTWSTPSFDCLWDCGSPTVVTNAAVSGGDTMEGTIRTYTCNVGYVLSGTATLTCQTGATWSAVAFTCISDCGTPSAIANAVVSPGGTLEGDTRTYSCSTAHVLRNVVTLNITCQPDTTWSTPSFDCLLDCGSPTIVTNAAVSGGDTVEGTMRSYTCNVGYVLSGSASITCQTGATWSAVAFTCIPDCSEPPEMENATVSAGDTLAGTTRNYTCNQGHVVNGTGPMTTTCQPNGTWTTVEFRCQPAPGCPLGWDQIGSSCYILPDFPMTIAASAIPTYCATRFPDYGTYMVQLETQEEDDAVTVLLQAYPSSSLFCIGLHEPNYDGVWVWMETNEPMTYSNWCPGEPNGGQYYGAKGTVCSLAWLDIGSTYSCQPVCEISLL